MTEIVDLKQAILCLIERGSIASNVLDILQLETDQFIERETELWDYKAALGAAKVDSAELVRDILAFHNSFGGYLIFGVADNGEVCGSDGIGEQTTRQLVRTYAGIDIAVAVATHIVHGKTLSLLLVPKRLPTEIPAAISKVGPETSPGKPIFKPGDIFFRSNDSSQLLRGSDDLRFLMGERRHSADNSIRKSGVSLTSNNLPDRSLIFNRFFGRGVVKDALWSWLADPLSRYRVIAGPGGVGKTSAAYSFCEEVCTESPLGLEQVVWLSAKRQQFSALRNEKSPLPYKTDSRTSGEAYSSYQTLLDAISFHLPIADDEWEDFDHNFKIRRLSEGLALIPTLVVVDDLDSLLPDDQKMAVELAMSLGQSASRFLFTTRKNYLAPLSSTTEVRGLEGDDFDDYVKYLQKEYGRSLTASEMRGLAKDTEGSPLFIESIFRLLRLGARFGDALARWKGVDGEAVRAAAFRRELEQLSWAAKRVLFSIALFETVSTAEVRRMVELELPEIEDAINELDRLFLVHSKQIGDQPRFGAAVNLRRIILENKDELVPSHAEISRRAATLGSEARLGLSRGKSKSIASVIQQTMAQLGDSNGAGALSTVESVLSTHTDSADLWMVYGRCLSEISPIDVTKTRNAFQKSFDLGKREPQLFYKWIEFEILSGNSNAAVDVGERGSKVINDGDWEWKLMLAKAHHKRGSEREGRREFSDAMTDMIESARYLAKSFKKAPASAKPSIASAGQDVHDAIWRISRQPGQFKISDRYGFAKAAVESGDKRTVCLMRMIDAVETGASSPSFKAKNRQQLTSWAIDIVNALKKRPSTSAQERIDHLVTSLGLDVPD